MRGPGPRWEAGCKWPGQIGVNVLCLGAAAVARNFSSPGAAAATTTTRLAANQPRAAEAALCPRRSSRWWRMRVPAAALRHGAGAGDPGALLHGAARRSIDWCRATVSRFTLSPALPLSPRRVLPRPGPRPPRWPASRCKTIKCVFLSPAARRLHKGPGTVSPPVTSTGTRPRHVTDTSLTLV